MDAKFFAEAERALSEVNEKLRPYQELLDLKATLEKLLSHRDAIEGVPIIARAEPAPVIQRRARLPKGRPRHRFQPNQNSLETRFVAAFRKYLDGTAGGQSTFGDGWDAVMRAEPKLKMSKDYGRSSLTRVGGRFGLVYESAECVRLLEKKDSPEGYYAPGL
jgi:hypothetical protein